MVAVDRNARGVDARPLDALENGQFSIRRARGHVPQVQKEEVRERIEAAALAVFAERGFAAATIALIAERAGTAASNLYRYHPNKEALLAAAVPARFPGELRALLVKRVEALARADLDPRRRPDATADEAFVAASERLLAFAIEHRLRVVIVLGRAAGTPWEGLGDEVVSGLVKTALAQLKARHPGTHVGSSRRFALELVYRNLVQNIVDILVRFDDGARIREAVTALSAYHLAGLSALLDA
jgi:AcrR family transcriptional regulator